MCQPYHAFPTPGPGPQAPPLLWAGPLACGPVATEAVELGSWFPRAWTLVRRLPRTDDPPGPPVEGQVFRSTSISVMLVRRPGALVAEAGRRTKEVIEARSLDAGAALDDGHELHNCDLTIDITLRAPVRLIKERDRPLAASSDGRAKGS